MTHALRLAGLGLVAAAGLSGRVCSAQAASPAKDSLKAVLAAARARVESTDVRASGRLVQVEADGTRKTSTLAIKAHWFQDGLHMIGEITSSTAGSLRFSLTIDPGGRLAIEVIQPGQKVPVKLPPEQWSDGLLGSNFSYEDLTEGQFLWTRQTLLPAEKYGARDCFVLKSEPGVGERSYYTSVTTWIDQKTGAPVHVERVAKGSVKQFIFYDLQQNDGIWATRQVEAKLEGSAGSSLLILERGSARAHLQRKDFDPAILLKP